MAEGGEAVMWAGRISREMDRIEAIRARQQAAGMPTVGCPHCRGDAAILPGVLPQEVPCSCCGKRLRITGEGDGLLIAAAPPEPPATHARVRLADVSHLVMVPERDFAQLPQLTATPAVTIARLRSAGFVVTRDDAVGLWRVNGGPELTRNQLIEFAGRLQASGCAAMAGREGAQCPACQTWPYVCQHDPAVAGRGSLLSLGELIAARDARLARKDGGQAG